jgi:hypothetical protein
MHASKRVLILAAGSLAAAMSFPAAVAADSKETHDSGKHDSGSAADATVREGESIQAAIDAASPGDTIVVKRGTYAESVSIQKNGITLMAKGHVEVVPPADESGVCNQPGDIIGICIVASDIDADGNFKTRTKDVTISGFTVRGFPGDGVFGFGTENLHVSHVKAVDDTEYGIASFDGIGTVLSDNEATGAHDAGLYVGDSPDARAVVRDNRSWGNALGILMRHTHHVTAYDNKAWNNCVGVFVLHDGQDPGSGDNAVLDNTFRDNDETCPQFAEFGFPDLGGVGILLSGSQHNVVSGNDVSGNDGTSNFSGGLVLVNEAVGNVAVNNHLRDNTPFDIRADQSSSPNTFVDNRCSTSSPDGLCESSHDESSDD